MFKKPKIFQFSFLCICLKKQTCAKRRKKKYKRKICVHFSFLLFIFFFEERKRCNRKLWVCNDHKNCFSSKAGRRPFCGLVDKNFHGEFDPGSGRTLAVCLTHASRTRSTFFSEKVDCSGGRVRNA